MSETKTFPDAKESAQKALDAVSEICGRYQTGALEDFLESCRSFPEEKLLNIAVFGRFKAGKSTFLNHLLGRPLPPVGVVPVNDLDLPENVRHPVLRDQSQAWNRQA